MARTTKKGSNNKKATLRRPVVKILGVIASSPTDIQPVLDAVAESAARLCDSHDAQIYRVEGDLERKVASYGPISPVFAVGQTRPIRRGSTSGRAILDRKTIHVRDIAVEAETEFPESMARQQPPSGVRTILATPLLREGLAIGVIHIRRREVGHSPINKSNCSKPSPTKP